MVDLTLARLFLIRTPSSHVLGVTVAVSSCNGQAREGCSSDCEPMQIVARLRDDLSADPNTLFLQVPLALCIHIHGPRCHRVDCAEYSTEQCSLERMG